MNSSTAKSLVRKISVITLIMAVIMAVVCVKGFFSNNGSFISFALFRMIGGGNAMSFIENLLSLIIMCGGFGYMGYYGLRCIDEASKSRKAFLYGAAMTVICFISMICSIAIGTFGFGDLLIVILSGAYTYGVLYVR